MRIIYLVLGFLSLFLGLIGIVIPGLPTTPFLLLTAFLFSKGSKRFYNWFINTKVYKNYLEDFIEHKSMTLKKKVIILSIFSIVLLISFLLIDFWHARLAIILVIIFKYYYFLFRIKTTKTS